MSEPICKYCGREYTPPGCGDGHMTCGIIATLTADLEQARRDIGRLVAATQKHYPETGVTVCRLCGCTVGDDQGREVEGHSGICELAGVMVTTPTADPRDAVVSAAREWVAATSEVNKYTRHQPLPLAVEDRMTEARTALRHAVQDIDAAATPARETFADRIAKANDAREAGRIMRDPARRGDSGGA